MCFQRSEWKQVHRAFYYGMLANGSDETLAAVMYWAVYRFGPRWSFKESNRSVCVNRGLFGCTRWETVVDQIAIDESLISAVDDSAALDEVVKAVQYIKTNKPKLHEIEAKAEERRELVPHQVVQGREPKKAAPEEEIEPRGASHGTSPGRRKTRRTCKSTCKMKGFYKYCIKRCR